MKDIAEYISLMNENGEKALAVFLTAGFPIKKNFTDVVLKILDAGADILELGFPFSDPVADGPIIQASSQSAIEAGIDLEQTFEFAKSITSETEKPVLLMGYANPVLSYGLEDFRQSCIDCGVSGIIIPDIPPEEYHDFFTVEMNPVKTVMLVTPSTDDDRLRRIDSLSSGFLYCVSVRGTTGFSENESRTDMDFIKRAYNSPRKNKMLAGFGIRNAEDAQKFKPHCDGVITGSAVIKALVNDDKKLSATTGLVRSIKNALR